MDKQKQNKDPLAQESYSQGQLYSIRSFFRKRGKPEIIFCVLNGKFKITVHRTIDYIPERNK